MDMIRFFLPVNGALVVKHVLIYWMDKEDQKCLNFLEERKKKRSRKM